ISSNGGRLTPFVDCLFVATSAVCVTGLVTVDTYTNWNYFGRTVIMILIQIGGLG
ncbi:MAG TPA: Trk family potassium uptake protein, partial [Clostridiaceae bacterium]|nr:Trk family potassium uptake protein [Clostridiaceae bacterium]